MKSSLPLSSFHISTVLLFCCSLPSSCSGSTASATSATLLLLMIVHMHIIAWCVLIFWIGVVLHVVCLYFSKREGIRYWPEGTQYERKGIRHSVVLIPILTSYKIPSIYILLAQRHTIPRDVLSFIWLHMWASFQRKQWQKHRRRSLLNVLHIAGL